MRIECCQVGKESQLLNNKIYYGMYSLWIHHVSAELILLILVAIETDSIYQTLRVYGRHLA